MMREDLRDSLIIDRWVLSGQSLTPAQLLAIIRDETLDNECTEDRIARILNGYEGYEKPKAQGKQQACDDVADMAGLASPAEMTQLRRVLSNRIMFRTTNSGASWQPVSMQCEVNDDDELVCLTEMVNGQHVLVRKTSWLWRWTDDNGWVVIDDRR